MRSLGLLLIVLVVLSIAIPWRGPAWPKETHVIREIKILHEAQAQYRVQFGRYARTLAELGPTRSDLIPASLASGEADGYLFSLAGIEIGYRIHADPKVFGQTGRRSFYSDQTMRIRQHWGPEPATPHSPEL